MSDTQLSTWGHAKYVFSAINKKVDHRLVVYVLIVLITAFGVYKVQSDNRHFNKQLAAKTAQFHAKEAKIISEANAENKKVTAEFHTQLVNSQTALCQNGNVLRTELRTFVAHLTQPQGKHPIKLTNKQKSSDKAFVKQADKAFASNNCTKVVSGKS